MCGSLYNQGAGKCHKLLDTRTLKEAERCEVICCFKEISFSCSFVKDAEAVKLHRDKNEKSGVTVGLTDLHAK